MTLIELCADMNAHCENRDNHCWLEWHPTDFSETLEVKRQGCYTFEYDNPDCNSEIKNIVVPKICDRCFERYLTYKYQQKQKDAVQKEDELIQLREKLLKMEMILAKLMESQ